MSDTQSLDPAEHLPQSSPGELLRREREALDLSREEVAAALNLRPAVIDGLEQDDYEEVPIATYRRGYLRSYANLLGLDEHRVLAAYRTRFGGEETEHKVTPVHVVNKPPSKLGAWLFRLVTLVVIAGLVGLTLTWWQSRGGGQPPTPADSGPVAVDRLDGTTTITEGDEEAAVEAAPSEPDGAPNQTDETPATADAGTAERPAAAAEGQAESTPAPAEDADTATLVEGEGEGEAPAVEADPRVLELTFNEQSWTEIFDANNQRVFVGLQEPGTTARVEGTPPFRLTVGNATGVELVWRGEAVDMAPRTGANNVARFTLGE